MTQYFFTVPRENLDVALRIEAIRMRSVLATEALWEKERGAIEQEVAQDLSNPEYVSFTRLLGAMFRGTPYAHDALGTRPSFDNTTGAMLREFHSDWYAPNNAILVIAGDVDPKKALAEVRRQFGPIPSRKLPARPRILLHPLRRTEISLDSDLPYGTALVAYRLPGYDSPDYAAGQVLGDVLGSKRGNLYALVPDGKALVAEFDGMTLPKGAFGYTMAAYPKGGNATALTSEMKGLVAEYVAKGIPADLVKAAKGHEIADAEFAKNSVSGLASTWSTALAIEGRNSPEDDIDAIRKVTVEDVNRVAKEYLKGETSVVVVLTPKTSGKPVSSNTFAGGESFAPRLVKPVALPPWARRVEALPPVPKSRVKPVVTLLPNGIRLLVQPETISGTISLYGEIKTRPEMEEPEGQEGVAQVLSGLFRYGTKTQDRIAYQKALDDIAAETSAGHDFSLRVLPEHFEQGVRLLAESVLAPRLPEEGFRIVRKETAEAVAGELESPAYLSRRALRAALYPKGDPALREAVPRTVNSLTLGDVKAYYEKTFRPDLATIVVIGQVTPEKAKEAVEKYFGGWRARGPAPATDLPAVPPNPASAAVVPDASRVQDEVTLAETVGITRSDPDYYPLQVGLNVLSGAFYATRLYRDLREETGLVYSAEAVLDAGKTRSIFAVFYACDPPNVSKARKLVERDIREMRDKSVTPTELRQAKTLLIRRVPLSEASVGNIAAGLLRRSREGLPLDEPILAARTYRGITSRQVKEAFERRLRPADLAQVTLGPSPE